MNMISGTLQKPPHLAFSDKFQKRGISLLLILSLHTLILYAVFKTESFPTLRQQGSALLLRLIPVPITAETRETRETKQENNQIDREKTVASKEKTRTPTVSDELRSQVPPPLTNEKPKEDITVDPALDPFATLPPKTSSPSNIRPSTSERERYRIDAGKAWKQVESELPVKRWLSTKKELSTMERFAQNLLEDAPAREIQTKEEMRPDGSRMTRVKTPRGEFCVVAPQPGRTYDVRGPEHRVMSCPIYF